MQEPDEADEVKLWRLEDLGIEAYSRRSARDFPKHSHDEWQFALGEDRWWHRHAFHDAAAGHVVVVPPGEVHATARPDRPPATMRSFYVGDAALRRLIEAEGTRGDGPSAGLSILGDPRLGSWFALLWDVSTDRATALERTSAFHGLVGSLLTRAGSPPASVGAEPRAVARAREFLHAYPTDEVRLADLAEVAGLSPSRLNRAFERTIGVPPHAYQVQLRVRRARTLVLGGAPLAQAAEMAGFADQSHLGRHFRKAYDISPGALRQAARSFQGGSCPGARAF